MRFTLGPVLAASVCLILLDSISCPARALTPAPSPLLTQAGATMLPPYGPPASAVASRDTLVLLGGPDRWDGRFETPAGGPDWQGWTSKDYTVVGDTLWHVSTFNAAALGDHGAGNHAMWCGATFPSGRSGYGNGWQAKLRWTGIVADPAVPSDVTVQAYLNHDTEPGFDHVQLSLSRAGGWVTLAIYEGWRINRAVDVSFTVDPEDYAGADGDAILLRWTFVSDEIWSDEDGLYPTTGGCQIDDIAVSVNTQLATYDDFEPGTPVSWVTEFDAGVGDFAHLVDNLLDLDPCRSNASWQVCFVDDGSVVPGTGGAPCIQWCYGPGGYVVNATGGLLGPTHHLDNAIISPALAWPDGCDQARVAFDVWRHEPLAGQSPGMLYRWRVRSTASDDPANLDTAPWQSRDALYYGSPAYLRQDELVGDLLVAGRRWVQVELGVQQYGWVWGLTGTDATPAPYFDNVAVKAWPATAPSILVAEADLPQDTFPAIGSIDYVDLGRNSCRFDMGRSISPLETLRNDPGDSIVITSAVLRAGAIPLGVPNLKVRLKANALFNPYRVAQPNGEGVISLQVQGTPCRNADGAVVPNRYYFDLPDSNLIFPGDVLHFYFIMSELDGADLAMTTWPADTTGFASFAGESPYPRVATMRALPTLTDAVLGAQPAILFWDDFTTGDREDEWDVAFANLGLHEGVDFDRFVTRAPSAGAGNGLGGRATPDQLTGYATLLYSAGDHARATLGDGAADLEPSRDLQVLTTWLQATAGHALLCGANLASSVAASGTQGAAFVSAEMGVEVTAADVSGAIGGQVSPLVLAMADNTVVTSVNRWLALGACPQRQTFDGLVPEPGSVSLAEFTNAQGQGGVYPYAALVLHEAMTTRETVITLPMGLGAVLTDPDEDATGMPLAARTRLLGDVLAYFGTGGGTPTDVPAAPVLSARNYPNPFNPSTTIAYNLPRTGDATLRIYDLRGRLVKTLLRGRQPAGPGSVVWDGTDERGAAVASGIYVRELVAGDDVRLGKMALIK